MSEGNEDFEPDFDPEDITGGHDALNGMAKMGLTVFRAARRDGATWNEAFSITAAFFAGMTKGVAEDDESE